MGLAADLAKFKVLTKAAILQSMTEEDLHGVYQTLARHIAAMEELGHDLRLYYKLGPAYEEIMDGNAPLTDEVREILDDPFTFDDFKQRVQDGLPLDIHEHTFTRFSRRLIPLLIDEDLSRKISQTESFFTSDPRLTAYSTYCAHDQSHAVIVSDRITSGFGKLFHLLYGTRSDAARSTQGLEPVFNKFLHLASTITMLIDVRSGHSPLGVMPQDYEEVDRELMNQIASGPAQSMEVSMLMHAFQEFVWRHEYAHVRLGHFGAPSGPKGHQAVGEDFAHDLEYAADQQAYNEMIDTFLDPAQRDPLTEAYLSLFINADDPRRTEQTMKSLSALIHGCRIYGPILGMFLMHIMDGPRTLTLLDLHPRPYLRAVQLAVHLSSRNPDDFESLTGTSIGLMDLTNLITAIIAGMNWRPEYSRTVHEKNIQTLGTLLNLGTPDRINQISLNTLGAHPVFAMWTPDP